ncbi:MAG: stage 0 sporulation family protein, partial [Firmicutes bacterium]|nr:stage 0 sporulation family protein [Bacillota bacterium]
MVDIVGVRFKSAGKVYYFDPAGFELDDSDSVIVETARGLEFGTVVHGIRSVSDKDIVKPLKKVVRLADEKDIKRNRENIEKSDKAMRICQEKIDEHGLEMKLVDVEYTFDNNKIIFYFTADGRVDFRQLVKDLAQIFKMRIELRQIGVRDEAKMMGGVGCCGRGLCCHEWMSDFHPVSIKMAKTQNLSLNPTKISGICGRLMCCLKYENDVYNELKKGMPGVGDRVKIREGVAVVTEANILEEKIKCRLVEEEADPKNDVPEKLSSELYTVMKGD